MSSTNIYHPADSLTLRRSTSPDPLVAPGPSRDEIERLVEIALRVPDHGRLTPWHLVLIAGEAKQRWVDRLMQLVETRDDAVKTRLSTRKLANAPLVVVLVSRPLPGHKVPEWEQWLSAGAVCMNLLNGAHAMGYGANWLTGWHAYDPATTALLALTDGERVAGVVLIGSTAAAAAPRPRPLPGDVAHWLDFQGSGAQHVSLDRDPVSKP